MANEYDELSFCSLLGNLDHSRDLPFFDQHAGEKAARRRGSAEAAGRKEVTGGQ
jgi:hypothetical protein